MIYLDHAATTPLDKQVLEAMKPYFCETFGNPSSQHGYGQKAANAVIAARDTMADVLGVPSADIYFTSGGTEAGNTALKGVCLANADKGRHIVVSAIEHPALIESAKDLAKLGYEVTFVNPAQNGIISPDDIAAAIRTDTVFVAVMAANNEVGTVQPIKEIYEICKSKNVFFYCDCVQIAGVLPFGDFPADGIGFSAHKFYGPKGFGGLYMRSGSPFTRLISGGKQERGLRGGTTYVAGAVGCAAALKKADDEREVNNKKIAALRDLFVKLVEDGIGGVQLNGDRVSRLPSNANFSFEGCEGEQIAFSLDLAGIAVSTGSACSSGAVTPSHVLLSMGLGETRAKAAVRFTFGKDNTEEEVYKTYEQLKKIVKRIRG